MITLATYRAGVAEYLLTSAQPAVRVFPVEDRPEMDRILNRALQSFCELTYCRYGRTRATALSHEVDLDADVDTSVCRVMSVEIDGAPLRDPFGTVGPTTPHELRLLGIQDPGVPTFWCQTADRTLAFERRPEGAGAITLVGFLSHSTLYSEDVRVDVPPSAVRALYAYAAAMFLEPQAEGDSFRKMQTLDKRAYTDALTIAQRVHEGHGVQPPLLMAVTTEADPA